MNRNPAPSSGSEPIRLSAEPDFALGDVAVHPSLLEMTRGGHRQPVEPRVMQVLVALARAGGAVVSRDELIQRCWEGRVVGDAAINRCIFRLRELADAGGGSPSFQIETIPRVGYRLIAQEPAPAAAAVATASAAVTAKPNKRVAIALATLAATAVLAGVALLALRYVPRAQEAPAPAREASIAVLPFKNLSSDADAAYFAAGIQDEILTRLAKIGSLKVISRTSADRIADQPGSLRDVARRLGVANILEGSVQRSGDTVRVNVQLIRVAGDDHLWAEDYDRKLDDVFSVENDVAGAIATALAANITPSESKALSMQPTVNPQAYDLYLRGLVRFREGGAQNLGTAVRVLEQAVEIDPTFAVAWALLSRANAALYFGGDGGEEQRTAARSALDKALAMKPDVLEVELANGFYKYHVERDFVGAQRAFAAPHAKWPNDVEVLKALGLISRRLGHWDESIAYQRHVLALDPLVPSNYDVLATTQSLSGDTPAAVQQLDAALKLWPDDSDLLAHQIELLQQLGQLDRADAALERLNSQPIDVLSLWVHRVHYAYRRNFIEGLRYFENLHASAQFQDAAPIDRGYLELMLGDFRRLTGDADGAAASYRSALDALLGLLREEPNDPGILTPVSIAYSGLGDTAAAMRYADQAAALHPLDVDPVDGYGLELYRAVAASRLGDRDAAIPALAQLLARPGNLTTEMLRLDPDFDLLRGDPRFDRLLVNDASRRTAHIHDVAAPSKD